MYFFDSNDAVVYCSKEAENDWEMLCDLLANSHLLETKKQLFLAALLLFSRIILSFLCFFGGVGGMEYVL